MTIRLSPELEALIVDDVAHGSYRSAEEFVAQAVMLHDQEQWSRIIAGTLQQTTERGVAQACQQRFSKGLT